MLMNGSGLLSDTLHIRVRSAEKTGDFCISTDGREYAACLILYPSDHSNQMKSNVQKLHIAELPLYDLKPSLLFCNAIFLRNVTHVTQNFCVTLAKLGSLRCFTKLVAAGRRAY